jgi:hypothetical protein
MKALIAFGSIFMMFVLAIPVNADANDELKQYFNSVASKVKATENADEKREILNESFQSLSNALDKVLSSGLLSADDLVGIESFKATLQEKQNELEGINGYQYVQDAQLNAFADYVVQDMEQASALWTILVVVLIVLLVLLII